MKATLTMSLAALFLLASAACADSSSKGDDDDDGSGPASPGAWSTKVVASFDPAAGELPEGVTVKGGSAYVGFAPLGEIARVDLATGQKARFATLPKPVPNKGFMTGLDFGPDGSLYAALVSFDPSVQPGIYRVPAEGGDATLFAKHPQMVFPNGLTFDASGALFVTDSAAGAIYKIDAEGAVEAWAQSDLLLGDQDACGGSGNGFSIGANGIAKRDGTFYITNTDLGSVVRITAGADGRSGKPELAAGPDCALAGADGLTTTDQGELIVAVNRQNKIVRVAKGGAIELVASGAELDFPASVTWDGPTMVATTFALANASGGKPARPGLVAIRQAP